MPGSCTRSQHCMRCFQTFVRKLCPFRAYSVTKPLHYAVHVLTQLQAKKEAMRRQASQRMLHSGTGSAEGLAAKDSFDETAAAGEVHRPCTSSTVTTKVSTRNVQPEGGMYAIGSEVVYIHSHGPPLRKLWRRVMLTDAQSIPAMTDQQVCLHSSMLQGTMMTLRHWSHACKHSTSRSTGSLLSWMQPTPSGLSWQRYTTLFGG